MFLTRDNPHLASESLCVSVIAKGLPFPHGVVQLLKSLVRVVIACVAAAIVMRLASHARLVGVIPRAFPSLYVVVTIVVAIAVALTPRCRSNSIRRVSSDNLFISSHAIRVLY